VLVVVVWVVPVSILRIIGVALPIACRRLRDLSRKGVRSRRVELLLLLRHSRHRVHGRSDALRSHVLLLGEEVRLRWGNPLSLLHVRGSSILALEVSRRRRDILHSRHHVLVGILGHARHMVGVEWWWHFLNLLFSLNPCRCLLVFHVDLLNHFFDEGIQLVHLLLVPIYFRDNRLQSCLDNCVVGDILSPQSSDEPVHLLNGVVGIEWSFFNQVGGLFLDLTVDWGRDRWHVVAISMSRSLLDLRLG